MGYILNEEGQGIVELARDFAQNRVAPIVKECDLKGEPPQD